MTTSCRRTPSSGCKCLTPVCPAAPSWWTKDGPISGDDEALELADRAQGFFLFAGRQLLADLGVVVVRVENTQSRSAFDTDETDRRYGFDVLFRYEREDKRAVPAISKPPITFTKEE